MPRKNDGSNTKAKGDNDVDIEKTASGTKPTPEPPNFKESLPTIIVVIIFILLIIFT